MDNNLDNQPNTEGSGNSGDDLWNKGKGTEHKPFISNEGAEQWNSGQSNPGGSGIDNIPQQQVPSANQLGQQQSNSNPFGQQTPQTNPWGQPQPNSQQANNTWEQQPQQPLFGQQNAASGNSPNYQANNPFGQQTPQTNPWGQPQPNSQQANNTWGQPSQQQSGQWGSQPQQQSGNWNNAANTTYQPQQNTQWNQAQGQGQYQQPQSVFNNPDMYNAGVQPLPNATTAMVLGIISIVFCGLILGVIAIVMGIVATGKYKANPDMYSKGSYNNAIAAIVCGGIGVLSNSIFVFYQFSSIFSYL
jgi:hypothetical protein